MKSLCSAFVGFSRHSCFLMNFFMLQLNYQQIIDDSGLIKVDQGESLTEDNSFDVQSKYIYIYIYIYIYTSAH